MSHEISHEAIVVLLTKSLYWQDRGRMGLLFGFIADPVSVDVLIAHGAIMPRGVLLTAISYRKSLLIIEALFRNGATFHYTYNDMEDFPVRLAVMTSLAHVKLFVKYGADISKYQIEAGEQAFGYYTMGDVQYTKYLLERGLVKGFQKEQSLLYSLMYRRMKTEREKVIRVGQMQMLIDHGINMDLLMYVTISTNSAPLVELLIMNGANLQSSQVKEGVEGLKSSDLENIHETLEILEREGVPV